METTIELTPVLAGACDKPGTKGNPYDYDSLIKYLADKEDTDTNHIIPLGEVEDYKHHGIKLSKVFVVIDGVHWSVNGCYSVSEGNKKLEISANGIFTEISMNAEFDEIYYKIRKRHDEFNAPVEKAGKFNSSEGGGWYVKKQLYKVDNKYFVNL